MGMATKLAGWRIFPQRSTSLALQLRDLTGDSVIGTTSDDDVGGAPEPRSLFTAALRIASRRAT